MIQYLYDHLADHFGDLSDLEIQSGYELQYKH